MRSTWAPKGKTPVLTHHFNWKRLSMSAAICFRPDGSEASLVFGMQPGTYNGESIMEFLSELHRHLDGDKVTLIWDGLPSHRSIAMQAFLKRQRRWLVVERLPGYAPDLNPVEQVWGNLKNGELANLCTDTIGEAEENRRPGTHPHRVRHQTRLLVSPALRALPMTSVRAVLHEPL